MMEELIRRITAEAVEEERRKPKPLPEAVVMELREVAKRYRRPCPFAVGDLVTPSANSNLKSKGEPHVVVDLMQPEEGTSGLAPQRFDGSPGSHLYGMRPDMRVVQLIDGVLAAFWVESASFDAWQYPSAAAKTVTHDEYVTGPDGVTVPSGIKIEVPVTAERADG